MSKIGGFFLILCLLFAGCAGIPSSNSASSSEGSADVKNAAGSVANASTSTSGSGANSSDETNTAVSGKESIKDKLHNLTTKIPKFKSGSVGEFIFSHWIYFLIIAASLIITPIVCGKIKKKSKNKKYKPKVLMAAFAGVFIIIATLFVGFFVTKDLGDIKLPNFKAPQFTFLQKKDKFANVNVSNLNLRSDPSATAKVLAVIKKDAEVQVLDDSRKDNWVRIKYNDVEGYVNKNYIK